MKRYVAALALLATACTGGAEPRDASSTAAVGFSSESGQSLAESVGPCPRGQVPPAVDAFAVVTAPGAWVHVAGIAEVRGRDRSEVVLVHGDYLVVGGDRAYTERLPRSPEFLYLPRGMAARIGAALEQHVAVTVRTGAHGDPREAAYAVATSGSQGGFVGDCALESLTKPLIARVGGGVGAYLRAMVGEPADGIRRVLAVRRREAPVRLGDPETHALGEDARAPEPETMFRDAWLSVRAPEQWSGGTVCAVIAVGRSGCVHLRGPASGPRQRFWYDPRDPRVELRLYQELPGRGAVALRVVDVARLAHDAGVTGKQKLLLRLDFAASPSYDDVRADPRRGSAALVAVRTAPCTVERCEVA